MQIKPYWYKILVIIAAAFVWAMAVVPTYNQAGSVVLYNGGIDQKTDAKVVALTFDDGPYGEPTQKILDILKEKNAKATFFVIGINAEKYPDLIKREIAEGHLIENHSYDHSKNLTSDNYNTFKKNINDADKAIFSASGLHPRFFRPPFGLTSQMNQQVLTDLGYQTVMWNDMTNDWEAWQTSENITTMIIKRLKPGAIIGLHDGRDTHIGYSRENTIAALPVIIDKIRAEGYEIVGLDQLIGQNPYFSVH